MKSPRQWLRKGSVIALGLAGVVAGTGSSPALADLADEAGAEAAFNRVVGDQSRLRVFVQAMPKGANLHNHLDGSVYAETYID
ncbi:MAG: adenosine deaminase, partial [Hyphomicrobiales bacterium]